jgi:hypothetical protein
MAVGLSTVNLANAWLNTMRGGGAGSSFTAPASLFVQLHTSAGDPGSAGTANVSSVTTRPAVTFAAAGTPTPGAIVLTGTSPAWASWAGTNGEIVRYISVWSASSAGTFYFSAQLASDKTVNTGDTLTLTALTFSLAPLAA